MEIEDVEIAVRETLRSLADDMPPKEFGFPVPPFRRARKWDDEYTDDGVVVGVHFTPNDGYSFVSVVGGGGGSLFIVQDDELFGGDLPYDLPPTPEFLADASPSDPSPA